MAESFVKANWSAANCSSFVFLCVLHHLVFYRDGHSIINKIKNSDFPSLFRLFDEENIKERGGGERGGKGKV